MNKFYITTAIDYVNAKPHLGHALEKIQADVLARYYRQKLGAENVHFLTGTDEHGQKIVRTAEGENTSPQELVDRNAKHFEDLKETFNLSFDDFIRTSDQKRHWPAVQKLWQKLDEAGALEKRTYSGLYCTGCESFKTEKELDERGHCLIHSDLKAEKIEEENYFFKLSDYQDFLLKHFEANPDFVWPQSRYKEVLNVIKGGLEDVSFSRPKSSLNWGVPVPNDPGHVMYVWCDALTNYISAVDYANEGPEFKKWWPADIHLVGKDITRFHAVIWPAMLHVAEIELPKQIMVHGFVTSGGKKMSKSTGNVVDPVAIAQEYGADALRYYLLTEIHSGEDGDFNWGRFNARFDGDLANNLGNLVQRISTLIERNLDGQVAHKSTRNEIPETQLRKFEWGIAQLWGRLSELNEEIEREKPWELAKTDKHGLAEFLANQTADLLDIAKRLVPYLPETADKIEKIFTAQKITAPKETLFPRKDLKG